MVVDGRKFTQSTRKKKISKTKDYLDNSENRERYRPFTKEAKVYFQELGNYPRVKSVEDSTSALSMGRLCDELCGSCSWQSSENYKLTKR